PRKGGGRKTLLPPRREDLRSPFPLAGEGRGGGSAGEKAPTGRPPSRRRRGGPLPPGGEGSITARVGGPKAGDPDAAEALWRRYFARLVGLARARLAATRRLGADADEEDAALSAFNSFCDGAARGRFPILGDRDDLWRLLVVLTSRKVSAQV